MPFCPICRREYHEGVELCPDCSVPLASALPETGGDQTEDSMLVELAFFPNASEAEMVQELLESNDIETVLRGETDPIGATSMAEPVTLLVEKHKFPAAKEIYDAYFAGDAPGPQEGRLEDD